MKILSVTLRGYVGIMNGLGLSEITMNLRGKNKIVLIKGPNGSGKSELLRALTPFPDGNDKFIPGVEAEKILEIQDQDMIYICHLKHAIKTNGTRETTKAYIRRVTPYDDIELNPNGNISSYKDILYTELNLDPNFISLGELSSMNRGLADKKPAERKKYLNAILDSVEAYNNIYKILTKRSSVFKSIINSITSKIDNIGDEEQLQFTLQSLETRINEKMNTKDNFIESLAGFKSKIVLLDPNGSIQHTYQSIYDELLNINNLYKSINIDFNTEETDDRIIKSQIEQAIQNLFKSIEDKNIELNIVQTKLETLLKDLEIASSKLSDKQSKLDYYMIDTDFSSTEIALEESKQLLEQYKSTINSIGVEPGNITKDEFIIGLNTINDIKETISVFKSYNDYDIIEKSVFLIKNKQYPRSVESIEKEISEVQARISEINLESQRYYTLQEISKKLLFRPSHCNIDSCQFIKDALEANDKHPEENIKRLEEEYTDCQSRLSILLDTKEEAVKVIECFNYLKIMIRTFINNKSILDKLPVKTIMSDVDSLLDNILSGYSFNELDEIYKFIDMANIIELYSIELEKNNKLEKDMLLYNNNKLVIDELKSDIESLSKQNSLITSNIMEYQNNKKKIYDELLDLEKVKEKLEGSLKKVSEKIKLLDRKGLLVAKFETIKQDITAIKEAQNKIQEIETHINMINNELKPLLSDRDKIKHGLGLLQEYKAELLDYSVKYKKIETIKKYSSPSKGIQTLFMELYMHKTISMANELLSLLFDGKFLLGQFEINESEFRIPCIGNNITNNDISSMSTAQICMISMVLSFVLLKQSSTRYNILKLDEIDGALDTQNRIHFLNVLNSLIDLLNVEQCFMISHNTEMSLSNCDVIDLNREENYNTDNVNYLYKYGRNNNI